jgi:hypothetical protein
MPLGKNYRIPNNASINEIYTLTLLTSVDPRDDVPICISLRKDSNTAENFLDTVRFWTDGKYLKAGDILIANNAKVHLADEIINDLRTELD